MGEPQVDFLKQTVAANAERIKEVESDTKMMENEFKQEIKELRKEQEELKTRMTVTEGNVNQIFTLLSKIEESTLWIKRTISKSLISGLIGAIFTAIIWLATK